jgi:hypothetical protein
MLSEDDGHRKLKFLSSLSVCWVGLSFHARSMLEISAQKDKEKKKKRSDLNSL